MEIPDAAMLDIVGAAINQAHNRFNGKWPQSLRYIYEGNAKNVYFFACEKWEGKVDQNKVKSEHQKSPNPGLA